MLPTYVTKSLIAASSTGIGTVSSASPGVATLNTSALDTARRIVIWSTNATLASAKFTIAGTQPGGGKISETITGPTSAGGATPSAATTQDFLTVTSVSASSVINNAATIGTNTQGGSPWQQSNTHATPYNLGFGLTFSSTLNSMAASLEFTLDDAVTAQAAGNNVLPMAGGAVVPLNLPPAVFVSTACSTASGPTAGLHLIPSWGWRVTLTSSSSTAGSINFTAIQAGIG